MPTPALPDLDWYEIDHRYSIHESPNSFDGGFQIKETISRSNGETIESFAYVKPFNGSAMLHVFTCIPRNLAAMPAVERAKRKDVIRIYDDCTGGGMFFVVVVARTHLEEADLPPSLTITRATFARYNLFVCSGIFRVPPSNMTLTQAIMTMASRYNGVTGFVIRPDDAPVQPLSPNRSQMAYLVEEQIDIIAERMKQIVEESRWDNDIPLTGDDILRLKASYDWYLKDPSGTCVTDRLQARAHRIAHPPNGLYIPPEGSVTLVGKGEPPERDLDHRNRG